MRPRLVSKLRFTQLPRLRLSLSRNDLSFILRSLHSGPLALLPCFTWHSRSPALLGPSPTCSFRRPPSATARRLSNHRPSGVCCASDIRSTHLISSQPFFSSR